MSFLCHLKTNKELLLMNMKVSTCFDEYES